MIYMLVGEIARPTITSVVNAEGLKHSLCLEMFCVYLGLWSGKENI